MMLDSGRTVQDAYRVEVVGAGDYWMEEVRAGETFRITDLKGKPGGGHAVLQRRSPARAL